MTVDNEEITLWGVGTTRTMRVHWLAHELGIDYQTRRIESRTGETQQDEYLALNPKQKIPTLVQGELVITESTAIMRHLRRIFDTLPYDDYQLSISGQAAYDEWLSFILMELDATSLYVVRRHRDLPEIYGTAPAAVTSSIEYFERMIAAIASRLPTHGFLWGNCFSELDIHMTVCLDWADHVGAKTPSIATDYQSRMKQRPAFLTARLHNFRDLSLPTVKT